MSIKGIRMRFAGFLTLLGIFEGTVHMNEKSLEKRKMSVLLLDF